MIDAVFFVRALRHAAAALLLSAVAGTVGSAMADAAATEPLSWFNGDRPSASAQRAVALLTDAASHGLMPDDYAADALAREVDAATRAPLREPDARARLDRRLTAAMTRLLSDLHGGRLPAAQRPPGHAVAAPFDATAALRSALARGGVEDAVADAVPRIPQYAQLHAALARYRALGTHPAWQQPLPPLPVAPERSAPARLAPGEPYAGLAQLRERLMALGDLPTESLSEQRSEHRNELPSEPPTALYDGALVAAVRAFQSRHGLTADGIIGRATRAALEIPPAARAQQIALTMERLRWTPLQQAPRMVVINLPEFMLRAYEVDERGQIRVRTTMKVIVGKALDTRTPVFVETMRAIEFSPYWNVPPSIARGETVPRLRRDPGYFVREGFEFVDGAGRSVTELTAAHLDAVLAGSMRLRQRPGPRNALGDIKFVFPNRDHIFLHHTPQTALFDRDRRDFSHGCIRVEQPLALALFVLEGMPSWTEARVRQAMQAGSASTVALVRPLPVLITYGTALVRQGRVHFFDDVYGHDRQLAAQLARPRAPLPH